MRHIPDKVRICDAFELDNPVMIANDLEKFCFNLKSIHISWTNGVLEDCEFVYFPDIDTGSRTDDLFDPRGIILLIYVSTFGDSGAYFLGQVVVCCVPEGTSPGSLADTILFKHAKWLQIARVSSSDVSSCITDLLTH